MAVAVFKDPSLSGTAVATPKGRGTVLRVVFTALPPGKHGFHIHVAGDLRGEGCAGACSHLHVGAPTNHGGRPGTRRGKRHSGDLGNVEQRGHKPVRYTYYLPDLKPADLWGRTLIVHADEDDLGKGPHMDSKTTGHSGARIGCAIFGRLAPCPPPATRRRRRRQHGGVALEILYGETVGGNNANPTNVDLATTTLAPNVSVLNADPSDLYTLIMYDPDAVGPSGKTTYLHWCVINRTAKNAGDTCMTYKAPSPPPGSGTHHYTFALYKQSKPLACKQMERAPFDLQGFETFYGLKRIQNVVFTLSAPA